MHRIPAFPNFIEEKGHKYHDGRIYGVAVLGTCRSDAIFGSLFFMAYIQKDHIRGFLRHPVSVKEDFQSALFTN